MLSSANTMVCSVSLILSQSKSLPSSFTCFERFSEASVHTAVESDRVGIEISVQRLELLITLYCGHGFLRLRSSLKINHGWPVFANLNRYFLKNVSPSSFLNCSSSPFSACSMR